MNAVLSGRYKEFLDRFGLVLILGLGLLVRLLRIATRGVEYDDTFSVFLAQRSLAEIVRGTAADTMPPLYYLLLHFWMQVCASVWFYRLLSVVLSLLGVYLLYRLVLALSADRGASLLAAAAAAISPFQFYHAQDLRNYALLMASQMGYFLFFVLVWRKVEAGQKTIWPEWGGLIACGTAAMYTHNMAVFGLAIPTFFLLILRQWMLLGKLTLAQAAIGLLNVPWLLELPAQFAKVQRAWWLWRPGIIDLIQVPVVWTAGLPLQGVWLWVGLVLGIEILAVLVLLAWRFLREKASLFLVLSVFLLPALLFGVSYLIKPVFVPRAFIVSSMAFYGLLGWAAWKGWRMGLGKLLFGGYVCASLIGLPSQALFGKFPRSPFEQAAQQLARSVQPGDVVVHDNKLSYFPFHFYQPGLQETFIADPPDSANDNFAKGSQDAMDIHPAADLQSAVGEGNSVYFVTFSQTLAEYKYMDVGDHPSISWLKQNYHLVDRRVYSDVEIYHFSR
jgi:mannosyltransferase